VAGLDLFGHIHQVINLLVVVVYISLGSLKKGTQIVKSFLNLSHRHR
jgi:hypothetical protein